MAEKKCIQVVSDNVFAEKYVLGAQLAPSAHRAMEIRHATRKSDQQRVVVKLRIKPRCFESRQEEKEWRDGTDFMLNLPRSNSISNIIEVLEDSRAFYIVTEMAAGQDLFEWLGGGEVFSVNAAREILHALLEGLKHLHQSNGIHKDLKLENVVVDGEGDGIDNYSWTVKSVKLIDFDTVERWTLESPNAKDVSGTDGYIAPESYNGEFSPKSDIFAVGVIGYGLLTGRFPFNEAIFDDKPGENWVGCPKMKEIREAVMRQTVNFNYPVFKENPLAADLLRSMLEYRKEKRYTAHEALLSEWMCNRTDFNFFSMEETPVSKMKISISGVSMTSLASVASTTDDDPSDPFLHSKSSSLSTLPDNEYDSVAWERISLEKGPTALWIREFGNRLTVSL